MNNKMKKFSKILMMTVAILLTLVLASTSVVSGIFAKYVVTKKATTTVSLQKFGLTLQVEGKHGTKITNNPTNSTDLAVLSVTVENLYLTPGQALTDVVKFTIGGESNVDKVNMVITATVDAYSPIPVPKGVGSLSSETKYLPIAFTAKVGSADKTLYTAWSTPADAAALQSGIVTGLRNAVNDQTTKTGNTATVAICTSKGPSSITNLDFGFKWEEKVISNISTDEISTYLAEKGLSVKVTYTVSLQQA